MTQKGAVTAFFTSREWHGRPYLISPFADVMLSGGLAMIVLSLLVISFPTNAPDFQLQSLYVASVMAFLAFAVNDPHFMVSYQLLYHNYRERLTRFRQHRELYWRTLVAGVIVPVLMLVYFIYAFAAQRQDLFSHAFMAMMVIVGWHYAKQAYGVLIVLSALKKIHYPRWQQLFFLINSYVVWIVYCIAMVSEKNAYQNYTMGIGGITYQRQQYLELSPEMINIIGGIFVFFCLGSIILVAWGRKNPSYSRTGLIGYLSMYYLLLTAALHPMLILVYPFFHSLQYLLFVYAYRRGELGVQLTSLSDEPQKKQALTRYRSSLILTFCLGVLFFAAIPMTLEGFINPDNTWLFPLTGAFIIFINIHHYFIDNVIWRKENREIGQYLFHPGANR